MGKTGYHTRSMLCVPIRNSTETKALGVLQMINKIEVDGEIGVFTEEDVEVLDTFAKFVGEKLSSHSSILQNGGRGNSGNRKTAPGGAAGMSEGSMAFASSIHNSNGCSGGGAVGGGNGNGNEGNDSSGGGDGMGRGRRRSIDAEEKIVEEDEDE